MFKNSYGKGPYQKRTQPSSNFNQLSLDDSDQFNFPDDSEFEEELFRIADAAATPPFHLAPVRPFWSPSLPAPVRQSSQEARNQIVTGVNYQTPVKARGHTLPNTPSSGWALSPSYSQPQARRTTTGSGLHNRDKKILDELRFSSPSLKRGSHVRPTHQIVYTDGACSNNQTKGIARAGVGVWFGQDDPRNVSEALEGSRQTNQRAEIMATIRALEICGDDVESIEIRTDSLYVIKGATTWYANWERNGWRKSTGGPIENRDLWERLLALIRQRLPNSVSWTHIKGHSGILGNEMADRLAVAGAAAPSRVGRRAWSQS